MKQTKTAILSIGSEILEGRILNTNSQWLSKNLSSMGFNVAMTATCNDVISEIKDSAKFLLKTADLLIVTGGLGPTTDDITRDGIAELVDLPLKEHPDALENIKEFFAKRNREVKNTNIRQALVPEGSKIFRNEVGTAPGFCSSMTLDGKTKHIISMPGPPIELKEMFNSYGISLIENLGLSAKPLYEKAIRVFGVGESTLGEIIEELDIPKSVDIAYRYSYPEIQILFKSTTKEDTETAAKLSKAAIKYDVIFSESENVHLPETLHNLLIKKGKTISFAESCTGGLVSKLLTDFSGSSAYLLGSGVTYANSAKTKLLNVSPNTLESKGAVSSETAKEMAKGVRDLFGSDIAVSITGIAGPTGGTEEKPVGTFHIGFLMGDELISYKYFRPGAREQIRLYAAHAALDLVRRKLLDLPPHGYVKSE